MRDEPDRHPDIAPAPAKPGRIVVINPNSSTSVTNAISRSLAGFGGPLAPEFDCRTLALGPATIITDLDVHSAGTQVAALAASLVAPAAVIIACFSDPGLAATRQQMSCPVIGVQEAAMLAAMAVAPRFGIIALSATPIPRHTRKMQQMGILDRLALEVGLSGASAHDVGHREDLYPEILAAGQCITAAGAGAVVLGCAGFGPRRLRLQRDLGVPVIDPVLAGAAIALATVPFTQRAAS
ncbi:aspartate/glutamate racemase family protein [Pseudogemmobacter sonorensis]|uniref:aspartate/glutamate racemase family protein n=1 Tax=Pseudogemmobacter sonorensis TaxID=2989681 RepID=UPI0036996F11